MSTWEGNFAGRLKEDFEIKGGAARPLIKHRAGPVRPTGRHQKMVGGPLT